MINSTEKINYTSLLQKNGLKVTKQRVQILSLLEGLSRPVTIEELNQSTRIVYSTLYRSLEKLVQANLVYKSYFNDSSAYYEFQTRHPHHITCLECGYQSEAGCPVKSGSLKFIPNLTDFATIKYHSLEFYGICKSCTI